MAANNQHQSSPPPAIEAELDVCLHAFAAARGLSANAIGVALSQLVEFDYSPDAICEASSERLKEITGLTEGQVLALKKFARQWCGKIDAKRARRGM
jgi:hypothetical protein